MPGTTCCGQAYQLPCGLTEHAPKELFIGDAYHTTDDFLCKFELGRGSKTRTFLGTHKATGLDVAMKAVSLQSMDEHELQQLRDEFEIHASLQHPGIVTMYGAILSRHHYIFLMEPASHPLTEDMDTFARKPAAFARQVAAPLAAVLEHLHSQGIAHRDIKPGNILVGRDGRLKVTDFGYAVRTKQRRPVTRLGTLQYMAPEVLGSGLDMNTLRTKDRSERTGYDVKCDIWSFGVLIFEALHGHGPFTGQDDDPQALQMAVLTAERVVASGTLPPEARCIISSCLQADPAARPSAATLLKHPFLVPPSSGPLLSVAWSVAARSVHGAPRPTRSTAASRTQHMVRKTVDSGVLAETAIQGASSAPLPLGKVTRVTFSGAVRPVAPAPAATVRVPSAIIRAPQAPDRAQPRRGLLQKLFSVFCMSRPGAKAPADAIGHSELAARRAASKAKWERSLDLRLVNTPLSGAAMQPPRTSAHPDQRVRRAHFGSNFSDSVHRWAYELPKTPGKALQTEMPSGRISRPGRAESPGLPAPSRLGQSRVSGSCLQLNGCKSEKSFNAKTDDGGSTANLRCSRQDAFPAANQVLRSSLADDGVMNGL